MTKDSNSTNQTKKDSKALANNLRANLLRRKQKQKSQKENESKN